jgi:hypothetical protein
VTAWQAAKDQRRAAARERGEEEEPVLLEPIGLHEARHTCANTLSAAGANRKVIRR